MPPACQGAAARLAGSRRALRPQGDERAARAHHRTRCSGGGGRRGVRGPAPGPPGRRHFRRGAR
eukprot:11173260-Lingulodinium_polyedra.AAC.1